MKKKQSEKILNEIIFSGVFLFLVFVGFMLSSIDVKAAELPNTIGIFGDVNGDREIDTSDILQINTN